MERVLVVGDAGLRALASDTLGARMHAASPADARASLSLLRPSLALVGVRDVHDLALLRALLETDPDTPVIVAADAPFSRAAVRMGVFATIAAAPTPAELRAALRDAILEHEDLLA